MDQVEGNMDLGGTMEVLESENDPILRCVLKYLGWTVIMSAAYSQMAQKKKKQEQSKQSKLLIIIKSRWK